MQAWRCNNQHRLGSVRAPSFYFDHRGCKKFQLFWKSWNMMHPTASNSWCINFLNRRASTVPQNHTNPYINLISEPWRKRFLIWKIPYSIVGPTISHLRTYSVIDLFEPLKKATAKRLCADIKIEYGQQKFRFEIITYYRPPSISGPNLSSIGPLWRILRSFEIWRLE